MEIKPRPSAHPLYRGKAFGSNASAWWGYQYNDPLQRTRRHEIVTIIKVLLDRPDAARAPCQYAWTPQKDPFGVTQDTMNYAGVPVDHGLVEHRAALEGIVVPARPHFGFIGVSPREAEIVDTIPPGNFGGNVDNRRAGPGARISLPVAVAGALPAIGDGRFSRADGEIDGTGLELSLTGTVRLRLRKPGAENVPHPCGPSAPLIETSEACAIQSFSFENHLRDRGRSAQTDVHARPTVDNAPRNTFRHARRFLFDAYRLGQDDAHALLHVAADLAVSQVVDGNLGVHAPLRRSLFEPPTRRARSRHP